MEKYYTPEEVAEILSLQLDTVRKYITTGQIKSVKVFSANRVRESDLKELIKERPVKQ